MNPQIYGAGRLFWSITGDRLVLSHSAMAGIPLAIVAPDGAHIGQWRVARPDGTLSDHANLSRAKDAAVRFALAYVRLHGMSETASNGPQRLLIGPGEGDPIDEITNPSVRL